MKPLRTVIVDDEALARRRIRDLLAPQADVEVVGECAFGEDAVAVLQRDHPDLVFLDVRLPDLDGFGVLERLDGDRPLVIFVTAFDQHAVAAFGVDAVDYLVKPFERERFFGAVERARRAGLVEKHSASQDRRVVRVELTRRGRNILERLSKLHRSEVQRFRKRALGV